MKESEKIKDELAELLADRSELNRRIYELKNRFADAVAAEHGLVVGDAVNVIYDGRAERGIYGGYEMRHGEYQPIVYKVNKNNVTSKNKIYTYGAKIEKA